MGAINLYNVGVVALLGNNLEYRKYDAAAGTGLSADNEEPGLGALFHLLDAGNGKVKVKTEMAAIGGGARRSVNPARERLLRPAESRFQQSRLSRYQIG